MRNRDTLSAKLAPYRDSPGIIAALLISRDGFVVAADAEADFNSDAVAAQLGGLIDASSRLATELKQTAGKYIFFELTDVNVVLAPFADELMLVLVGAHDSLFCDYRLKASRT